eukprot:TRINITY_DN6408_c0_g1_i2.p2 TRINITY_DN6408_c0_g1~~TRINITY_DN6408_c0_g1_i2.p2  ORF type:complete len:159 (+),score=51.90 TRINITY_DN6408_c0_g1_i2:40-516(+)
MLRLSRSLPLACVGRRTMSEKVVKTDVEWKAQLSDQEYRVLREAATDRPGTGGYTKVYPKAGHFACKGCGAPLYSAGSKFDSRCGWPAFDQAFADSITVKRDSSMGMERIEILCARCDGHLGHVFNGEGFTITNQRHCVNSSSITLVDEGVDLPQKTV